MTLPSGIQGLQSARDTLQEAFGFSVTHTAGGVDTVTTARLQSADSDLNPLDTGWRDQRRVLAYVSQAAVAAPQHGDRWVVAEGPWAGTWYQATPPLATAAGEWQIEWTTEPEERTADPGAGIPALGGPT